VTRFIALIAIIASLVLGASAAEAATPGPPRGITSVNVATCDQVIVSARNLAPSTALVAVAGNATAKVTSDANGALSATFTRAQVGGLTGSAYTQTAAGVNTSNIMNFTMTACATPTATAAPAATATARPAATATASVARLPSTSTNDPSITLILFLAALIVGLAITAYRVGRSWK
jgi:hypothetical protein